MKNAGRKICDGWKSKRLGMILILFLVFIILIVWAVHMKKSKDSLSSRVNSTAVETGTIKNVIDSSGTLQPAETTDVQVPNGLEADTIIVSVGEQVSKGQILARLNKNSVLSTLVTVQSQLDSVEDSLDDDTLTSLETEELEEEKEELKELKSELKKYRKNPVIKATTNGIIGNIGITEKNGDSSITNDSSEATGSTATKTVGTSSVNTTSMKLLSLSTSGSAVSQTENAQLDEATASSDSSTQESKTVESETTTETKQIQEITDFSSLSVAAPAVGEKPQSAIKETSYYSGKISWNPKTSQFKEDTAYIAKITLTAKNGYTFTGKSVPTIKNFSVKCSVNGQGEGNQLIITASFEKISSDTKQENTQKIPSAPSGQQSAKNSGNTENMTSQTSQTAQSSDSANDTTKSSSNSSTIYETSAFTIQNQSKVIVNVNVDELDILSVSKGQTATIVLDAIEGEEFEGTVTKVSNISSSDSGNAKYPVEIKLAMDENMRFGMSATASIQVDEAVNVPVLSMAALQERDDETFVYTKKESDGTLSGEKTIQTGLSDGENVEIVSGLEEGDTVYYTRNAGNANSTSDKENGMQMMPGQNGSSNFPDRPNKMNGGEKPQSGSGAPAPSN
ncbi:MAG: HlyD family efflux transporter periplasmic adaptor subunit [Lachnospiraceae bacterium]|nr:HlyD family efflux transporter periplasmic adaptor subunit [Lachnospiraceae bacterium]